MSWHQLLRVLCTKHNDANTHIDNNTAQLHKLSWKSVKIVKIGPFRTNTSSQSKNGWKSIISRSPCPPTVKIIQHQSIQEHYAISKWKLPKISPYRTITPSQNGIYSKSVLSSPPLSPRLNCANQCLKDYHILPKWKLSKVCSSRTTTPPQSKKFQ